MTAVTACAAAPMDQDETFSIPKSELVIKSTEKFIESSENISSKKMQYSFDIIPDSEKNKVGSLNLEFDYLFSPELGQTEIKNYSIQPVNIKGAWDVEAELLGIAGTGTDLSAIEYNVFTSNNNDKDDLSSVNNFTITVDADGSANVLSSKFINLSSEKNQDYLELKKQFKIKAKQTGHNDFEKLIKSHDSVLIEGTDIVYQIKEYESDPFLLGGTIGGYDSEAKSVDDLYTKTASYEIAIQYDGEAIGIEKFVVTYFYSPTENYASISVGTNQMQGYDDWVFKDDPKQEGALRAIGNGTNTSLYRNDLLIEDNGKIIEQISITISADSNGNLSIKPITS